MSPRPASATGAERAERRGSDLRSKGEEREHARLAARHRPGAEGLVANADARCGIRTGDAEGGKIGHADVEIMLFRVDAYRWRLRHHCDFALDASGFVEQAVRCRLDDELRLPILELRSGFHAGGEVEGCVFRLGRLAHLPDGIARAILLHSCRHVANAALIADMHGNGRGLTYDARLVLKIDGGFGRTANGNGHDSDESDDRKKYFAHHSILGCCGCGF